VAYGGTWWLVVADGACGTWWLVVAASGLCGVDEDGC
jgi:hypothetical protein